MSHYHAVVWLDHNEARVMHISPDDVEKSVVSPATPHRNLHRKRGSVSGSRQPEVSTIIMRSSRRWPARRKS